MSIKFRPTKSGIEIFGLELEDIPEGIWILFSYDDVEKISNKSAAEILKVLNIPSWVTDVLEEIQDYFPVIKVILIAEKLKDKYVNLVEQNKKSKKKGVKICFHFQKCGGFEFGPVRIRK